MLASARMSAWRPAPLVGSVAAKVRTAGRFGGDAFMGRRAGEWRRYTCNPAPIASAGRRSIPSLRAALATPAFYSTASPFSHVIQHDSGPAAQDLALPRL